MSKGDKVKIRVWDPLFDDFFEATGTIKSQWFINTWTVTPDKHPRLNGADMNVHINNMWKAA